MRLIDADRLLKTTQTYDLIRALEQAKEVKAIPLDKVKQTVEEIGDLPVEYSTLIDGEKVLAILDRLIESED